jgi:uncharacterized protein (DUF1501 family)
LGAGAAAAVGLTDILTPAARAASSLNRCCVCIYLLGGNDSNNMLVPLEGAAYGAYAKFRGALALSRSALLPVDSGAGAGFGFHPNLAGLRDLYNQNALAVVANVGPARQAVSHTEAAQVRYLPNGYLSIPWADSRAQGLSYGVALAAAEGDSSRRSVPRATAPARPLAKFPDTIFGRRLEEVANTLRMGALRQNAFLVPLDGFDTHANQLAHQANAFSQLNDGLVAFYNAIGELGMGESVTVYTDTEFNRTLVPNAAGGTGHAWGGHQLILGGSTLGGRIYGTFPSLEVGGPDDAAGNGTWKPTTSDLQYAATLAAWYGIENLASLPAYAGLRDLPRQRLDFLAH